MTTIELESTLPYSFENASDIIVENMLYSKQTHIAKKGKS